MRVLILGATGPTGQELVKQALDSGHQVNVLARSPDKLQVPQTEDDKLKIIKGDIFAHEDLRDAMTGCDGVLSALGARPALFAPCDLYSKSLDAVVKVMKELKVKRFIGITAMGTTDHPDLPFVWRWLLKPTVMRNLVADMRLCEEKLEKEVGEDIDWTVVKPPRLLKAPITGVPPVAKEGQIVSGVKAVLTRGDLAKFMLECLVTSEWSRKLVTVVGGTTDGQGKTGTAEGQGKVETAEGQGKVETAEGQGKVETAEGQGKVETAEGQGKVETAEGQGKVEAAEGQGKAGTPAEKKDEDDKGQSKEN